jgi:PAS domain S-box-containing protein
MSSIALDQLGSETSLELLIGPGLVLLVWAMVLLLSRATWRRRRGDDVSDLLMVGGPWLVARLVLLIIGLPRPGQPGDEWLAVALDLTGLMLLAWPFLSPPLSARWAGRLVGIGLLAVFLTCGVALLQWAARALGLAVLGSGPTLTWAHSALALAGLAVLNLSRWPTRRTSWLLTAVVAFVAGIGGLLISLPVAPWLSSILTATAAAFATIWLNWLERPRHALPRTTPSSAPPSEPQVTSHLLEASTSLFSALDLADLLKAVRAALAPVFEVQHVALLLADDEDPRHLRLIARWPQAKNPEATSRLPRELSRLLADILEQGQIVNVARESDGHQMRPWDYTLGTEPEAALVLPLTGTQSGQGLLVLGHRGPMLNAHQLQLCRIVSDQVANAVNYIQMRINIGQQSRSLARVVRRQEQEASHLNAILESIADGVIVSDANDQVILVNNAALSILGEERSNVLGQPFGQILGHMAPVGEVGVAGVIGSLRQASSYGMEAVFEVSDRVVQTSMAPVETSAGVQSGVVAVLRDITAMIETEAEREQLLADLQEHSQQLEEAALRLREMDALKSQFIANMSHEFRTPLNAIIGFSGVMLKGLDGELTETQREDMGAVHASGKHLLGLINSVLDISQIWAGKMELMLSDVNLQEVVDDTVTISSALIGEGPIEVKQVLDSSLPTIRADKTRLREVLLNLLNNAIKYSDEGEITVSAWREEEWVVISVSDTGIGIAPEHLETIFEQFSRVDSSSTRRVDGLGLGLSICRRLVELHGGEIWAESAPGVGSTFYFKLPIQGPPPSVAESRRAALQQLETSLPKWQ